MLTTAQWQAYKDVVNLAAESFNQDIVTWYKLTEGIQRYGEDSLSDEVYQAIPLSCLISYNVFRTWPMTKETVAGALDKESIVMMLNRQQMINLGYTTTAGFFAFNSGKDYFIHMGITYKAAGETAVSQAGDEPLHFYIILKRQETPTGTNKY